jgi:large subunit ribosomal protein L1
MGAKRNTGVISSTDEIKIVEAPAEEGTVQQAAEAPKKKAPSRIRSKRYVSARGQVDKTKKYPTSAAIELVKKLSYAKFDGTITAHVVVKEVGVSVPLTLPHSTGKSVRVAIASDKVLAQIADGKIDFDILVAHPSYMPKLAKFAPVLGPKGLMPNPKNGTLTPNPEGQKQKLEAGTVTIKTEKKAPLLHVRMGKNSMETKKLVENVEALMKALGTKAVSLVVASSMSPGVKVEVLAQ